MEPAGAGQDGYTYLFHLKKTHITRQILYLSIITGKALMFHPWFDSFVQNNGVKTSIIINIFLHTINSFCIYDDKIYYPLKDACGS